jgi:hypothetical protein
MVKLIVQKDEKKIEIKIIKTHNNKTKKRRKKKNKTEKKKMKKHKV